VDVSKPVGSRILQLMYQDRVVQPTDTFTLALIQLSQGGGGGFRHAGRPAGGVQPERERARRDRGGAAQVDTLRARDYAGQSWQLTPAAAATALRAQFGAPVVAARDSLLSGSCTSTTCTGARATGHDVVQGTAVGGVAAIKD